MRSLTRDCPLLRAPAHHLLVRASLLRLTSALVRQLPPLRELRVSPLLLDAHASLEAADARVDLRLELRQIALRQLQPRHLLRHARVLRSHRIHLVTLRPQLIPQPRQHEAQHGLLLSLGVARALKRAIHLSHRMRTRLAVPAGDPIPRDLLRRVVHAHAQRLELVPLAQRRLAQRIELVGECSVALLHRQRARLKLLRDGTPVIHRQLERDGARARLLRAHGRLEGRQRARRARRERVLVVEVLGARAVVLDLWFLCRRAHVHHESLPEHARTREGTVRASGFERATAETTVASLVRSRWSRTAASGAPRMRCVGEGQRAPRPAA